MSTLIETRIILKRDYDKRILALPLRKRKAEYKIIMDKNLKLLLDKYVIKDFIITKNYGAPHIVRGYAKKSDLKKISNERFIRSAKPRYEKPKKIWFEPRFYWALIKDTAVIEGQKKKAFFFYSIAFKAKNAKDATKKAQIISGSKKTIVSFDHKFRKKITTTKVIIIECCDTQLYHRNPPYIVGLRVAPNTDKYLKISTILDQKLPIY